MYGILNQTFHRCWLYFNLLNDCGHTFISTKAVLCFSEIKILVLFNAIRTFINILFATANASGKFLWPQWNVFTVRGQNTHIPPHKNFRRENRNDFNIRNEDALSVTSFPHNYHPFKYMSGWLVDKSVLNKKERTCFIFVC